MGAYKYKAFISYSHKDERWARWLHRRLENYPIPSHLIGKHTGSGEIPKRVKPIFRDREELAAADSLGEKIEQALADSENLIIICSPHAAQSHWVNQEIISFKRQNRGAKIFSLIVDGEPFASNTVGRVDEECFPPALRFDVDTDGQLTQKPEEPLAADIRTHADGKRLGILKLVAGMIGVELDEIIQRDMRRGRKRVMAITAASFATVLAMGTLTGFAINARNDAEARRNDAEGLIEFMQTDLRDKLAPIKRLDVLSSTADEILKYYNKQEVGTLSCRESGQWARALQFSSDIKFETGESLQAGSFAQQAAQITSKRLLVCEDRKNALIDHGHSLYYVSFEKLTTGGYELFKEESVQYESLVNEYCLLEGEDDICLSNQGHVAVSLGVAEYRRDGGSLQLAIKYFQKAISAYERTKSFAVYKYKTRIDYANAHGWLADALVKMEDYENSIVARSKERKMYDEILSQRRDNFFSTEVSILRKKVGSELGLARVLILANENARALSLIEPLLQDVEKLTHFDPHNKAWQKTKLSILTIHAVILYRLEQNTEACIGFNNAKEYQNVMNFSKVYIQEFNQKFEIDMEVICNKEI